MSGSLPVQYSKIQLRRGLAAELPGIPNSGSTVPTQGLDIAELGYATDTGQLFIGLTDAANPTIGQGLPQLTRATFPYDNIEVVTENSNLFLQTSFDIRAQDVQTAFVASDPFVINNVSNTNDWSNVSVSSTIFVISLANNPGNAQIQYYLFDPNSTPSGNPVKTGMVKVTYNNNSTTPSMTDTGTAFQRLDESTTDPNVAFGSIQFRGLVFGNAVTLQYRNITNITPVMYFRVERANGIISGGSG